VVPRIAFHVTQIVARKAKPPVLLVVGQANKPACYLRIFVRQYRLVTLAGLADAECQADQANSEAACRTPLASESTESDYRCISMFSFENLLRSVYEKILLLTSAILRGDYRYTDVIQHK